MSKQHWWALLLSALEVACRQPQQRSEVWTAPTTCGDALAPAPTAPDDALAVTVFGAVPDDGLDDTEAIRNALRALHVDGWLVFPKGR